MSLLQSRMTLRNLRLIDAIAHEGNLLRAAQSLSMTQSAVTKALQETEASTGCTLFQRTNRGVVPTPFGQALTAHARVILTQLGHAEQELADLRDGSSGMVTVGTLLAASVSLLPRAIALVRSGRPNLTIRTLEGTNDSLMPQLRQGGIDLIVGRLPVYRQRDGIVQQALQDDHAVIVARRDHPLTRHPTRGLADLAGSIWILPLQETTLRRQVDEAFRLQGLKAPTAAVESVSVLVSRDLMARTDMLAVWPAELAEREAALGRIAVLPVDLPTTRRPLGVSTRDGARLSPAADLFIQALRNVAATPDSGTV